MTPEERLLRKIFTEPGRYWCSCGKYITRTKAGSYRHHRSLVPEWPGSLHMALCEKSGTQILPDCERR